VQNTNAAAKSNAVGIELVRMRDEAIAECIDLPYAER
jgi:hypothetical protein